MNTKDMKSFVCWWNNLFTCDHWFREKYKIAWNSKSHREHCLIDMYFEYIEESVYEEYEKSVEENKKNAELLEKGIWLKEAVEINNKASEDIFDKIDIFNMNNNITEE